MRITAVVEKGSIKLPSKVRWASGTVVQIERVGKEGGKPPNPAKRKSWPVAPPKVSKKESLKLMRIVEEQFGQVDSDT